LLVDFIVADVKTLLYWKNVVASQLFELKRLQKLRYVAPAI
jgi:hypothetical protein